jgi:hypothetical protein
MGCCACGVTCNLCPGLITGVPATLHATIAGTGNCACFGAFSGGLVIPLTYDNTYIPFGAWVGTVVVNTNNECQTSVTSLKVVFQCFEDPLGSGTYKWHIGFTSVPSLNGCNGGGISIPGNSCNPLNEQVTILSSDSGGHALTCCSFGPDDTVTITITL